MPKNTKKMSQPKKQGLDATLQLAAFAARLTYDDLPEEVRHRAKMFVLDGLGVLLGAVACAEQDGTTALTNTWNWQHHLGVAP